jgi:hypothetical protein
MIIKSTIVNVYSTGHWSILECHIFTHKIFCTRRLVVTNRSGSLLMIIYECAKHYNYLQAYLQIIQTQNKYKSY